MFVSDITFVQFLYAFTFLCILGTVIFQVRRPTSLWNGAFFLFDLMFLLICVVTREEFMQNRIISALIIFFMIGVFLAMLYFVYILFVFTLWNGIKVLKRERFSLSMSLTLILGIGNLILVILMILDDIYVFPFIVKYLLYEAIAIEAYFVLWFLAMIISMWLYGLHRIRKKAKYIIVLGAGLINGNECSPLLKGRVNKGIERYWKQINRGIDAVLVMSGGQGPDELIPESVAMKNYAIEKGIPEDKIVCEEQSTTTLENMQYSKDIILGINPECEDSEICFVTSNYHVFRAAHYIRRVGLKSNGEGCKTAGYFLPNALIREYLAIVKERPKFHIFVVSILLIVPVIFQIVFYYLNSIGAIG